MGSIKRSISFRPEVWERLTRLVGEEGGRVSTLVNEAVLHYFKRRDGLRTIQEWEAENGPFTAEEIAEAERELAQAGVIPRPAKDAWANVR